MFYKKYLHNKFFYAGLVFTVWVLFFDQESMLEQYRLSETLDGLRGQKEYYQNEIARTEQAVNTLTNDSISLERYAREKYYMKKSNEDVFVIVRENEE
jgi:cell division protein FtsB